MLTKFLLFYVLLKENKFTSVQTVKKNMSFIKIRNKEIVLIDESDHYFYTAVTFTISQYLKSDKKLYQCQTLCPQELWTNHTLKVTRACSHQTVGGIFIPQDPKKTSLKLLLLQILNIPKSFSKNSSSPLCMTDERVYQFSSIIVSKQAIK